MRLFCLRTFVRFETMIWPSKSAQHVFSKVHYKHYSFKGYNGTVQLTFNLTKLVVVPFKLYRPISQFLEKNLFALQASSTVMPALLKGDFISIPHFLPVSVILTNLSKLAPRYGLSLDSDNPGSSTLTAHPSSFPLWINRQLSVRFQFHTAQLQL